jgi:general secretion pathway protein K
MRRRRHKLSAQCGSAIIVALFVMSLAAAAAVAMLTRSAIDMRRTQLILNSNQATLFAQGSVAWAIDQLNNDLKKQKPNQLVDRTPIQSKVDTIRGFKISSTIYDMQASLNLNNLTADGYQNLLLRLIRYTDPKVELSDINNILIALRDWVSPSSAADEENYYTHQDPPYRAPHRIMTSVSELRLVKSITPEAYQKLLPYVTALPVVTPINVNSAPVPVLMSLSASMTKEAAQTIVSKRQESPFPNIQSFMDFDVVKNNPVKQEQVTVISNFFLVKTSVTVGQQRTILYTLLSRAGNGPKTGTSVLWQTKGTE